MMGEAVFPFWNSGIARQKFYPSVEDNFLVTEQGIDLSLFLDLGMRYLVELFHDFDFCI